MWLAPQESVLLNTITLEVLVNQSNSEWNSKKKKYNFIIKGMLKNIEFDVEITRRP